MRELLVERRVEETRGLLGAETTAALQRVVEDSARVLEEVGFNCSNSTVRELLEQTGLAAFDESTGHVHVLPELLIQAVERAPKNDAFWLPLQSYGFGGTAPYFRDDATGELVEATPELVQRFARLSRDNAAVSFSGRGVKLNKRNAEAIRLLAEHTDKTLYVGAHTEEEIDLVEQLSRSRGKLMVVWDIMQSPLTLSDHMVPAFLDYTRRGLPMILASMPMPAVNAPYSMTGLLTMAFAEFLAGLALVQTVQPGTLVVCGAFPSVTDIKRRYTLDFGGKYHNVANALMSHVARMLDLPSCQSGCTTNEKELTDRAVDDARMGYALFKKYGCHMVRHAFGFTKELIAFSFAKAERTLAVFDQTTAADAPAVSMPRYDEEGVEVIARNASNANYMQDEHTLRNTGVEFVDRAE